MRSYDRSYVGYLKRALEYVTVEGNIDGIVQGCGISSNGDTTVLD